MKDLAIQRKSCSSGLWRYPADNRDVGISDQQAEEINLAYAHCPLANAYCLSPPNTTTNMKAPSQPSVSTGTTTREITFAQAINEALAEEMRRDPRVFIIGEDVA